MHLEYRIPVRAHEIAASYSLIAQVEAVVLAGSQTFGTSEVLSDMDLYVYAAEAVSITDRKRIATQHSKSAEVDNSFWESGDEWIDHELAIGVDVMFRSTDWIGNQLDRVLKQQQASVGYTTCFWHNVLTSKILFDRNGWFAKLQNGANIPYPEELRRAIIAKNYPILRKNQSSYRNQLLRAIDRKDLVSINHRVAATFASYFDIVFAINRLPHPGEKRLLSLVREKCAQQPHNLELVDDIIRSISTADQQIVHRIDDLLDGLDRLLAETVTETTR